MKIPVKDAVRNIYRFRCKYCGSESAYVTECIHHSHSLIKAVLEMDKPEKGMNLQMEAACLPEMEEKKDYTQITCAGCGAVWSSAQIAFNTGGMYLFAVESDQSGTTFIEHPIPEEQQNGLDVYTDRWGDAVQCNHCGWAGFVVPKEETCPNCREMRTMKFQHEKDQQAFSKYACYGICRNDS